jgi:predicted amidohydrolase
MNVELKISLIQAPLEWESPDNNRMAFSERMVPLRGNTDLIILPEMFTTGFTMQPENISKQEGLKSLDWMREEAKAANAAICGSIAFEEDGRFYNRLYFISPEGREWAYNKRHTFTLAGEDKVYTAGQERILIEYRGFKICPLICYDLRFPVWSRNVDGYDLLIYVANWPAKRVQAWDALLKARAIENMAYCAGVNRVGTDVNGHEYTGHSAVYDCLGNSLAYSEENTVLHAVLNKDALKETRASLRFLNDRDSFSLVL